MNTVSTVSWEGSLPPMPTPETKSQKPAIGDAPCLHSYAEEGLTKGTACKRRVIHRDRHVIDAENWLRFSAVLLYLQISAEVCGVDLRNGPASSPSIGRATISDA